MEAFKQTNKQTNRRMDGNKHNYIVVIDFRTDKQTDRWTDKQTDRQRFILVYIDFSSQYIRCT